MEKKLLSLLLTLTMLFSIAIPAFAAVKDTGFADVDAGAWYADAAVYCRENGLMGGTTSTTFDPSATMARSMLATVLYRAADAPQVSADNPFSDVAAGAWYTDAILWAQQEGILSGYGGGQFGPSDPVTREQIAAILWRDAGSPEVSANANFSDIATVSSFATTAVHWVYAEGIVTGKGNNRFDPQGNATRAEVATILMNYRQRSTPAPTPEPTPGGAPKVLVAYFSCTNTTKPLAESVADALSADLYEITPEVPYTSADLNYGNDSSRSSLEMNDPASRPAITGSVEGMDEYDIVFLGYPIWWGVSPKIISTFLEGYDFSGKTIVPFCTSGSSGLGSSATNLHDLTEGAEWLSGQRFSGGTSRVAMVEWVNGLGLDITAK